MNKFARSRRVYSPPEARTSCMVIVKVSCSRICGAGYASLSPGAGLGVSAASTSKLLVVASSSYLSSPPRLATALLFELEDLVRRLRLIESHPLDGSSRGL
jgi:hypothetical protein